MNLFLGGETGGETEMGWSVAWQIEVYFLSKMDPFNFIKSENLQKKLLKSKKKWHPKSTPDTLACKCDKTASAIAVFQQKCI